MTHFEGWALPRGARPPETREVRIGQVAVLAAEFDPVAAVRLIETLRSTRTALARRPARSIARVLGAVGQRFLDPEDPLRREAIQSVAAESGLSAEMAAHVLDGMAEDWTGECLERLIVEEFGTPPLIDGFTRAARRVSAVGDAFAFHLVSGSVPGVGTTSLIRSLLVKSPVLVKPGSGDVALVVLFARALAEADAELADSVAVTYWPGGEGSAEETVVARADRVVVYGGSSTIRRMRGAVPPGVPIVEYGHRVGFSVVGPARFDADALARAIGTFDQKGCVTTHQLFVLGDEDRVEQVAGALAESMRALEGTLPRGVLDESEAARLRQDVETDEMRAIATGRAFHGGVAAGWTLVESEDPGLRVGPGSRSVRLVRAHSIEQVAADVQILRHHLQTVGYGGFADGGRKLAAAMSSAGATRIVPFGRVAFPPAWWFHDGRGPLEALAHRVEWEEEGQPSSSSSTSDRQSTI